MKIFLYIVLLLSAFSSAQQSFSIRGTFSNAANKDILLKGYDFDSSPTLSSAVADKNGYFVLSYPYNYTGAAILEVKDTKSVIVLLNKENFSMSWPNLDDFNSLSFKGSYENDAFAEGLVIYQNANAKISGLSYLAPLYIDEPQKLEFLNTELRAQYNRMKQYIQSLSADSYSRYYLNLRRLVSDMPQTPTRYPERLPLHEQEFNSIDFSAQGLIHSGLYRDILENYVILMESSGQQQYQRLNTSTDTILISLKNSPELRQDVAEYLFKLFEKRSLYPAAEHLALSMLNDSACTIDAKREALFEQYRKMSKGSIAPDILLLNTGKPYKYLSDIKSKYKLLVFGAGWCPTCKEEAPKLKAAYNNWKSHGLEVIYISLDTDKVSFLSFSGDFPWVTASDFKSWEGKAPRDYFVSATPTMYLLSTNNRILLKPTSPEQLTAWLNQNK